MGTSKGYTPPTGNLWKDAKTAVTNMVKNQANTNSIGNAVSKYVSALKSEGAAVYKSKQAAVSNAGAKSLGFINAVQNFGFNEALKQSELNELIGKSSDEVFIGLLDYFTGNGSSLDESAVRGSMAELMKEKFTDKSGEKSMEDLIKDINIQEFMMEFIIKCIQKDFFTSFAEQILLKCNGTNEKVVTQNNIKNFIKVYIESKYTKQEIISIDWNGQQGRNLVAKVHEDTLNIFLLWGEEND